jgi:hypothetical protein
VRQTWGVALATPERAGQRGFAPLHFAWQATGDKRFLESLYAAQIEAAALREYINTEGSLWIDRVNVADADLQRARLGGIALVRNSYYPGHAVSWKFHAPANEESTAILIPNATRQSLKIIAYNLSQSTVRTTLTAWDIEPGRWEITQGVDTSDDDAADGDTSHSTVELERTGEVELNLPPRAATVITLRLISKGVAYWSRPDLGIGRDDIVVQGGKVSVTVHSLGAVDSPPTTLALLDREGKMLASAPVPGLKAPSDLMPKTITLTLNFPAGSRMDGASVVIDPESATKEITRINNRLQL